MIAQATMNWFQLLKYDYFMFSYSSKKLNKIYFVFTIFSMSRLNNALIENK